MKLLTTYKHRFFSKLFLLYRLCRAIKLPSSAEDIIRQKEICNQLILRHLINGAQRSFASSYCRLDKVNVEIKLPSPVEFNIRDKVHLLFLNADSNDPLLSILRRFSAENTAFLDIGSNIGFYTYFYLMMGDGNKAFSFEPNPSVVKLLKTNIGNIASSIFEIAVSDSSGKTYFYFDEDKSGRGSLERNYFRNKIEVTKDRLDNVLPINKMKFDKFIIKIDVEEHEPLVLKGMSGWLYDKRPKLIYLEARPDTIDEIFGILKVYGYKIVDERLRFLNDQKTHDYVTEIKRKKYTNIAFVNDINVFKEGRQ